MNWPPDLNQVLISPTAMGFVPIVILQLLIVGYLLSWPGKSRATRLLTGWLACVTLVMASQLVGYTLYSPVGGYISVSGGIGFQALGLIFLIQFAYHFPRPVYRREAQVLLIISGLFWSGLALLLIFETVTRPILTSYDFEQFFYGFSVGDEHRPFAAAILFDTLHPFIFLWVVGVWLRQTVHFSRLNGEPAAPPGLRQAAQALWRPQGKTAQTARTFALVFAAGILTVLASILEPQAILPPGSFATAFLVIIFAFSLIYLNHAPESSTFMVRLVGISLVALLVILGLVNPIILNLQRQAYEQARQTELAYVKTLVETKQLDKIPTSVLYLAARPANTGLFSPTYRLPFSRVANLDVQTFITQDAYARTELEKGSSNMQVATLRENPWLQPEQVRPEAIDQLNHLVIPTGVQAYRGFYAGPQYHFIRYNFTLQDTLYEVGYSYLSYRQEFHRLALTLVGLTLGATLLILFVFPYLFRVNLVQPLTNLLDGVKRVNDGDLTVTVPVRVEDEFGFLTRSFNRMVHSLQASAANLQQEIAERQKAEAEVRALNVTLEQQVANRTRQLRSLYEVSAVASRALTLETLLAESLRLTLAALRSEAGAIYLPDEKKDATEPPWLRLAARQGMSAWIDSLPADRGLFGEVMAQGKPVLVPDMAADPRAIEVTGLAEAGTLLVAPLLADGQVLGLLSLGRRSGQIFNVDEIALVVSIADQVGVAVGSHRLRQQTIILEERQRIARDLHDSVIQSLYGLVTLGEAGQVQLKAGALEAIGRTLALVRETTRQALKEMRLFIYQLHPPVLEQEGLIGALHQRLDAVEGRANVQARLLADEVIHLPLPVEMALYQISQEALNNALRHARAANVTVHLGREGQAVVLEIIDDGCGFNPAPVGQSGMGLDNMHQRAKEIGAVLNILSKPGEGTRVKVVVEEGVRSRL
jgi:signal transduction histidine kinase